MSVRHLDRENITSSTGSTVNLAPQGLEVHQVRHDGQEGLHLVSPLLVRADPGPGTQHQAGEGSGEGVGEDSCFPFFRADTVRGIEDRVEQ